ncbi:MAG: xanthine dehydrogenase family protein molybdopterin-binding subunit [Thermoanaerobaculia bacterium]
MTNETGYRLIGRPTPRVDGRAKVTGAAAYAADHHPEGLAYASLVKSTIARGRITSIDTRKAEAVPGVLAVITPQNRPKIFTVKSDFRSARGVGEERPPLEDLEVYFFGQDVAVVVAASHEAARQGAQAVAVSYQAAPAETSLEAALPKAYEPAEVGYGPPVIERKEEGVASVEAAWQASEVRLEAEYRTPFEHHNPMEPHATVALWQGDRLTVYEPSQWMVGCRNTLADFFGLPAEKVQVLSPFVGGGFGCKAAVWHHTVLAALAARVVGRPVKLVLAREQMWSSVGHRPATIQKIWLGARKDGALQAIRHHTVNSTASLQEFAEPTGHRSSNVAYRCPNVEIRHQLVRLNVGPPTWMRAPGEAPGSFALESALDELAHRLQMDPIAVRLANYAEQDPSSGRPWTAKALKEAYAVGAAKFEWEARKTQPGAYKSGDWWLGLGMATALYPGYRSPSSARVRLLADGTAVVSSATHDLGTGMYTLMAQVAAEELGLPLARVRAELGDSSLPPAAIAGGSMSTASVLPAVVAAARSALANLASLAVADPASPLAGLPPAELLARDGKLASRSDASKAESFTAIFARLGRAAVEATESAAPGPESRELATASFGAHFVAVRVHRHTLEVRVNAALSVINAGRILNPTTARSQIQGGVIWGIGMALMEESHLDPATGRFTTADLGAYHVPVNLDVPRIEVEFVGEPDTQFNPLGARGIGEIGITGLAAAIANAVFNATGRRVRELPLTPDRLLASPVLA